MAAQEANDGVTLSEATVEAARTVKTADGFKLYPTAAQLAAAQNGFDLIARLSLPQIKVDVALQTISANALVGTVEVRINGIVASPQDLMSLDMKAVRRIDYIEHPDLALGSAAGRVIDIKTRRAVSGYAAGGQFTQAFTTRYNNSSLYAKYNRGRQEFSFSYGLNAANWNRVRSTEEADYLLSDNSRELVVRDAETLRDKHFAHNVALKYNLAETDRYVMQVALTGRFDHAPAYDAVRMERRAGSPSPSNAVNIHSDSKGVTPQVDWYFQYTLPRRQSVTANAVGTCVRQTYNYWYDAAQPYAYHTDAKQYNLNTELRYQKGWRHVNLAVGGRYGLFSGKDDYAGSIATVNRLNRSQYYMYARLSGEAWRKLNYQAAVGFDGLSYKQNEKNYDYRQVVPVLALSYNPSRHWSVGYSFKKQQCVPRLVIINDITSMNNEMEYIVGNPGIQPHDRFEHTATADYQSKRLQSSLMALYRTNPDTWMDDISRGEDNKFYFRKQNKGDVNMLYISNQTTVQIIPQHLDMTLNASFIRCFNFADTYTNCYSAWMGGAGLNAYWGAWSLSAGFDNGWRSMEGETKVRQGANSFLTVSRRLGGWGSLLVAWQNMFSSDSHSQQSWLMNRNVLKHQAVFNGNLENMLFATLSINLSKGRNYQSPQKTMENTSVESSTVITK